MLDRAIGIGGIALTLIFGLAPLLGFKVPEWAIFGGIGSGILVMGIAIGLILGDRRASMSALPVASSELRFIKTGLRLQFFGDHRIPQEVLADNVVSWFAYFSPSITLTSTDTQGNVLPGGMMVPPNWAIFLVLDEPAAYRQAIMTFSNPELMPITEARMANSRAMLVATRGQVPAGVLEIRAEE